MPHVVIIGAGVSGLAAARHLSHKDDFRITLFEAADRVGGRIKTVDIGGQAVDLGASWMHSVRQNPLFDEALAQKWPMAFTDNVVAYYTENGKLPRTAGILPIVEDIRSMIAEDFHQEKPLREEGSLKDYIESAVSSMPLITSEQAHIASLVSKQTEHFIGQSWLNIPAGEGGDTDELGRNAFVYGKGYTHVLDWLYETINWDTTKLNLREEVVSLSDSPSGFIVQSSQDSACENACKADYVICTVPLGALKANADRLLGKLTIPVELTKAITQTDTAALGKIILQFDEPFWDTAEQEMVVVHSETQAVFSIINPFPADSAVLIVLTGPPMTQIVESNPESAFETVKWALEAIRSNSGVPVPEPIQCVVTGWTQAPNFRCSYSARSIGQNYNEMIQPFIDGAGSLRFAGEHTAFDGNGCVHGAYLSGIREAEAIMDLYLEGSD